MAFVLKFMLGRIVLSMTGRFAGKKESIALAVIFAIIALIAMGLFALELGSLSAFDHILFTVVITLCEVLLILVITGLYRKMALYRDNELRERLNAELFSRQKEKLRDTMRIYHDMNGVLLTIEELLKNGKNEEALLIIREQGLHIKNCMALTDSTGNEGLDAALMQMIVRCAEGGIDFSYAVLADLSGFDKIMVLKLCDNLFRNAAAASSTLNKLQKRIEFKLTQSEDGVEFLLKNDVSSSVLEKNPHLKTTKSDKILHGYGMENVMEIVRKYDGSYERWEEKKEGIVFCQRIIL